MANVINLPAVHVQASDVNKNSELFKCFKTVTEGKELCIDHKTAETIIKKDLSVQNSNEVTLNVLMESLPFYMQNWPGWTRSKEYLSGKLTYETWFNRFSEYLMYKMNTVIKNEYKYGIESFKDVVETDSSTQTSQSKNKEIKPDAPYCLEIAGLPNVVSNLVFLGNGENIIIKQHNDRLWQPLQPHEYLNWPYVGVEINLPDISLSRVIDNEYHRYIALSGDLTVNPHYEFIHSITPTKSEHKVYSNQILFIYVRDLINILRKIEPKYCDKVKEISAILHQFLTDISAININDKTIATNTTISYNIGKSKYLRNKKILANVKERAVNFYEVVIPRVHTTLNSFTAQQIPAPVPAFLSINNMKSVLNSGGVQHILNVILHENCILYKCVFCKVNFNGSNSKEKLLEHLAEHHRNEQGVLCFKCRKTFEIKELAGNRWAHGCV